MTTAARESTAARLVALMRETAAAQLPDDLHFDEFSKLQELPVNSRTMRTFLVAVEDAFDHEWDIDTPPEVFTSFQSLADHLDAAAVKEAK